MPSMPATDDPEALGAPPVALALKPKRLKKRAEFLEAARSGRKAAVGGVVLQALPCDRLESVRLGFTVTRKVGNAVIRNRTRRRLKEAARLVVGENIIRGFDLVLIGRDSTRRRDFIALQRDIKRALEKLSVI
jgi:ribonuclease P protein component